MEEALRRPRPRRSVTVGDDLRELYQWRTLVLNLARREISGKYKRTALGQLWSLLNPLAQMATFAILFGLILRTKPDPGNPSGLDVYVVWLSCGLLPWLYFSNCVNGGMASILGNANLVQKVYFPRAALPIAQVLASLFTHATEMAALIVVIFAVGGTPVLYLPMVVVLSLMLGLFALGMALVLSIANVYFRDTQHLFGIVLQLWFYASGILFPLSLVARRGPTWETVFRLNPVERFIEAYRNCLYDGRWPSLDNMLFLLAATVISLAIGLVVFSRYEGNLAEEI